MGELMKGQVELMLQQHRELLLGDFAVAVGDLSCQTIWTEFTVKRRINYAFETDNVDVRGTLHELPFIANSIDVFCLSLTLEYSQYPHTLLREINRCISAEGVVVITGFNPFSLTSLCRLLPISNIDWFRSAQFLPPARLIDWLHLLDFEVQIQQSYLLSDLIFAHKPWLQGRFDLWCQEYLTGFGSLYTVIAKKRTVPLSWHRNTRPSRPKLVSATSNFRQV